MIPHRLRFAAITLVLGGASPCAAASQTKTLDCKAPRGAVARTICGSSEYVAMDREIAALTDRARAELTPGEESQLTASTARYIRQRAGCEWAAHNSAHPGTAIDECVRASLEERVRRLRAGRGAKRGRSVARSSRARRLSLRRPADRRAPVALA